MNAIGGAGEPTLAEASKVNVIGWSITPTPTDEEAAAIVAAYEALWPQPSAVTMPAQASTRWRFSGRWWTDRRRRDLERHTR